MLKKVATVLGAVALLASMTACNTFAGFGKDVQKGGEKVENAAERAK